MRWCSIGEEFSWLICAVDSEPLVDDLAGQVQDVGQDEFGVGGQEARAGNRHDNDLDALVAGHVCAQRGSSTTAVSLSATWPAPAPHMATDQLRQAVSERLVLAPEVTSSLEANREAGR